MRAELDSVRVDLGAAPGTIVIGRHPSCPIRVANTSVSRHHVAVSSRRGRCHVRDLGSTNGTTLNGAPVEIAELRRGDRLTLGEVLVRVV
jgi:pSer/pThr/pTyr-binding forkhead associated (FHA) protein